MFGSHFTPVPVVKEISLYAKQPEVLVGITLATNGGVPITSYHVSSFIKSCAGHGSQLQVAVTPIQPTTGV